MTTSGIPWARPLLSINMRLPSDTNRNWHRIKRRNTLRRLRQVDLVIENKLFGHYTSQARTLEMESSIRPLFLFATTWSNHSGLLQLKMDHSGLCCSRKHPRPSRDLWSPHLSNLEYSRPAIFILVSLMVVPRHYSIIITLLEMVITRWYSVIPG